MVSIKYAVFNEGLSSAEQMAFRKKLVAELKIIQADLHLIDVDMCNFMCLESMREYNEIMRMQRTPTIFNLIMFICSIQRPLYCTSHKHGYTDYQRVLHLMLLRNKK